MASIRDHVNLSQDARATAISTPSRFSSDLYVTDLAATIAAPETDPPAALAATRAALVAAGIPADNIGYYVSSWIAALPSGPTGCVKYPVERVDVGQFAPSELLGAPFEPSDGPASSEAVDYADAVARGKLIGLIVAHAVAVSAKRLMTDNWIHNSSWPGFIDFDITVAFLAELTAALAVEDCEHWPNMAVAFGSEDVTDADVAAIAASGIGGLLLETIITSYVASSSARLARWLAAMQAFIAAGIQLTFIPVTTPSAPSAEYDAEARFLAGLALVVGGPLVNYPYWLPNPEWHLWNQTYGAPTGAIQQTGSVFRREFGNYYFEVDCAARTVTIGDSVADIRNTIADRLWTLLEAQATITAAVLPGNRYKGNESGWLRKEIARAPADRRGLEISFARGTHSLYTDRNSTFARESTTFTTSTGCDFRVFRNFEVVITLREPLPTDPGDHAVQEAIEQTIFNAEPTLGLPNLILPDGLGASPWEERPTRKDEFPNPGRITTWRLPITTIQSALALRAQAV